MKNLNNLSYILCSINASSTAVAAATRCTSFASCNLLSRRSCSRFNLRQHAATTQLHQTRDTSSSSFSPEGKKKKATIETIAESLRSNEYKKVLVVSGAGVSVSAGIPDFRSPGSGLYDNLHKYNLPYPEAIFDLDFYKQNPQPFVTLAKEIWPGVNYRPTLTHCFFSLLDKKGVLSRVYTQNIDGLEAVAGVTEERLVECHGHFRTSACTSCGAEFDAKMCQSIMIEKGEAPKCNSCGGLVKPDIVFFGEVMPSRFSDLVHYDVASADLVIVLGSSLMVAPVCSIPDWVKSNVPRLLINRECVGTFGSGKDTDVFLEGDCDESVRELCRLIGWEDELDKIYANTHAAKTKTGD